MLSDFVHYPDTAVLLQDRRAELVRANKERLMAAEKNETASSG